MIGSCVYCGTDYYRLEGTMHPSCDRRFSGQCQHSIFEVTTDANRDIAGVMTAVPPKGLLSIAQYR